MLLTAANTKKQSTRICQAAALKYPKKCLSISFLKELKIIAPYFARDAKEEE
jgi:hypothetical protein